MVRLVFRPYTQVRKAICTSAHLRASTRVSSGFALLRHSSPSFGSQHTDSDAIHSQKLTVGQGWRPRGPAPSQFPCASWVCRPPARTHVALLGPCFKTGASKAFRRHHGGAGPEGLGRPDSSAGQTAAFGDKAKLCSARATDAGSAAANSPNRGERSNTAASCDLPCLPSQQFQALFNSLFKVLFIFPSRYLFAIGLPPVFSLRWDLPPTLCCIPKQHDSPKALRAAGRPAPTGLSPTRTPPSRELGHRRPQKRPR